MARSTAAGVRIGLGLGFALLVLSTGAAQAQAPGVAPARPGPAAFAHGRGGPVWQRPGRGFAGRGFRGGPAYGGLAYGGLYPWGGYGAGYGDRAGVANVDASVRTYPSPDELAPAAWSYGTYGIPTVPGIVAPPKGSPVVYVIESPARRAVRPQDAWVAADPQPTAGGARVVNVRVPR